MSAIDRKRAPVLQTEPGAQLPARAEREAILSRARALVARKEPGAQLPARAEREAILSRARALVARKASAPVAAVPVAEKKTPVPVKVPAAGQRVVQAAPPATRPREAPAQNGAAPASQTIIVQVAAPYPYYYGPYWWGYHHPLPCSSRNCPLRLGQPCTRWLCN